MFSRHGRQGSTQLLIMYMIGTLLFLTSSELHIHTQDAAKVAEHGAAVSISTLSSDLDETGAAEIKVSPDGVIKINPHAGTVLALFLLVSLLVVCGCRRCIGRLRYSHFRLPTIAFYGTPPLRAPPVFS